MQALYCCLPAKQFLQRVEQQEENLAAISVLVSTTRGHQESPPRVGIFAAGWGAQTSLGCLWLQKHVRCSMMKQACLPWRTTEASGAPRHTAATPKSHKFSHAHSSKVCDSKGTHSQLTICDACCRVKRLRPALSMLWRCSCCAVHASQASWSPSWSEWCTLT